MKLNRLPLLWILSAALFFSARPLSAGPSAEEIIERVVKRDKELQARRKNYDYDLKVVREKLQADRSAAETHEESSVVVGDRRPDYETRKDLTPEQEAEKASKEEPFELLNVLDHFTYTLDGTEDVNGVPCYKVAYHPKPGMPYRNREEKVINQVSGWIWVSQKDYSLMKNTGSLTTPVQVGWIFATLKELEFSHDTQRLPNGDFGPKKVQYRFLVSIPFGSIHERHTRNMGNYRETGGKSGKGGAKGPGAAPASPAPQPAASSSALSTKR